MIQINHLHPRASSVILPDSRRLNKRELQLIYEELTENNPSFLHLGMFEGIIYEGTRLFTCDPTNHSSKALCAINNVNFGEIVRTPSFDWNTIDAIAMELSLRFWRKNRRKFKRVKRVKVTHEEYNRIGNFKLVSFDPKATEQFNALDLEEWQLQYDSDSKYKKDQEYLYRLSRSWDETYSGGMNFIDGRTYNVDEEGQLILGKCKLDEFYKIPDERSFEPGLLDAAIKYSQSITQEIYEFLGFDMMGCSEEQIDAVVKLRKAIYGFK